MMVTFTILGYDKIYLIFINFDELNTIETKPNAKSPNFSVPITHLSAKKFLIHRFWSGKKFSSYT